MLKRLLSAGASLCLAFSLSIQGAFAQGVLPPGTVIDHYFASTQKYVGSPSIVIEPNGTYVATHDEFGLGSTEYVQAVTHVFQSHDRGVTWREVSKVNCFWGTLFNLNGTLYLIGTTRNSGWVEIMKSTDDGLTWSRPTGSTKGILLADSQYQLGPGAVLVSGGRVWKAVEDMDSGSFGYRAMLMSAPAGSDLLQASNWKVTNRVPGVNGLGGGRFQGWLEGNVVVSPAGKILDMLRVTVPNYEEVSATLTLSTSGTVLSYDKSTMFQTMPGAGKKFTIRFDQTSGRYWTLANRVAPSNRRLAPISMRNELDLMWSTDLKTWTTVGAIDYHNDNLFHGFQYADWQFDGQDIVAVVRVAFDDAQGGANTFHNANYLTFQRIANFRHWGGIIRSLAP